MASLHPQNAPQGTLSINVVVLVVILLNGVDFLVHEENVFMPVLGMPLETLCSCPSDLLSSRSKEVSL
jgi:hypothetical protein